MRTDYRLDRDGSEKLRARCRDCVRLASFRLFRNGDEDGTKTKTKTETQSKQLTRREKTGKLASRSSRSRSIRCHPSSVETKANPSPPLLKQWASALERQYNFVGADN